METLLATAKIWIGYLARSIEIAAAIVIGIAAIQATFGRSFYFSVLAHLPKPRTGYASPSAAGSPSRSNWNWQPTS